jgi:hypothetical protein
MVEPVTITVLAVGTVMLLSTIVAAMGVALAPTVSSPEDKYLHRDDHRLAYEKLVDV